jgi:hypothetical protein
LALREQLEVITFHVNKYRTYQTKKMPHIWYGVAYKKVAPSTGKEPFLSFSSCQCYYVITVAPRCAAGIPTDYSLITTK